MTKKWTDEECDELWERKNYSFSGVEKAAEWYRRIIRAAVDEARAEHHADCTKGALLLAVEARREEREFVHAEAAKHPGCCHHIVDAILARDKEPNK